ncbi:MFS transporter [Actinoplanes sp. NPDC051851]|uniref:MFS transporter n=1 Tax=Actinoplanes sp. NPDC051851 TaxID=3154753 RepID=UPI00341F08DF
MTDVFNDTPATVSDAPRVRVGRTIGLILVAALGMYVMQLTLSSALSLRMATVDPAGKEGSYSLAVSVSSLLLLIAIPLGGALSDRTTSALGRRKPWIVGGLVLALATSILMGVATSVGLIAALYVIATIGTNIAFNCFAVIPVEALPDNMRARVMGLMGMFGALAMSLGSYMVSWFQGNQTLMMTAPVLLAVVCSVPLLVAYRDPAVTRDDVPTLNVGELARGFVVNPRKHPNFGWTWLSRFLAGIAMTALFSYFIYFMMDGLGVGIAEVGQKAGLLTLASAPVSVIFFSLSGWVSDKIGRRKPFIVIAALIMAAALVIGATAHTFAMFLVAWLVFAVGQAMFLTVDLALCAAVLPDAKDTGKDFAVFQLALSLPNVAVPALAPTLLGIGGGHNYALLWGLAAALCAAGALAIRQVRGIR